MEMIHIVFCVFNQKHRILFASLGLKGVDCAAMTYIEFKHELKRAKLSVKALAELLEMQPNSITNYKMIGTVPQHLAVIAVMVAELSARGCGLEIIEQKLGK